MIDSSRGYQESNPPSRDLMAQFDMAKDDRNRPPEVRAYLENLRPQILKLQKQMRLQTEEDIAGLDRRDDLDMNEVDKLVDLIKAFRKAWTENKVSGREVGWTESAEAMRAAGPAYREMARLVRDVAENPAASPEARASVIEGIATSGEPALAWRLSMMLDEEHDRGDFVAGENDSVVTVPAVMAIWAGLVRRGETPPVPAESLVDMVIDDALWKPKPGGTTWIRSNIEEKLVRTLVDCGYRDENLMLAVVERIKDDEPRLRALLFLKDRVGTENVTHALNRFETFLGDRTPEIQMEYFYGVGNVRKAMNVYDRYSDNGLALRVSARWVARWGQTDNAFLLLDRADDVNGRMLVGGTMAAEFCKNGDLTNARRAIGTDRRAWELMDCRDVETIVEAFLGANETEFVTELAMSLSNIRTNSEWNLSESVKRVVALFADRGLDPRPLMGAIAAAVDAQFSDPDDRLVFTNMLRAADASLAFRTFKRAARFHRPLGSSRNAEWDRDAWEREMREVLDVAPDLANELTYDAPIP